VLIDAEGRGSICDFGLSIILDGEPTGYTSSNFGGTLRFLAPELLDERTRTVETDIYAYACTCIQVGYILAVSCGLCLTFSRYSMQILFDLGPYHLLSEEARLIRAILDSRRPPYEPSDEEVTFPSVLQVLKRCWSHDRSGRPPVNLIIDTLQRCLYRTYQTNLNILQGIVRALSG
jgi:Protein kinase domain